MNYYLSVLSNYAQFNGRARRSEYWYFALFNGIISVILMIIDEAAGTPDVIRGIYSLVVLIPSIAVTVRRMHDVGKSGWFCLIPIYNFVLACTEGDEGTNEYGPDPKAEEVAA
jgi:uncharacterized membrane protein YhaH (DUF805 family)